MKATKKLLKGVTLAVLSLGAVQAASAREFADIYTECGLGAMIAPRNSVVAAITNVTWDLGSTAISSNVSSADTCQGGKAKTAAYVFQSYAQLEQDIARGEGEYLTTLMAVAGCSAPAQAGLTTGLRQDLAVRVSAPAYSTASRQDNAAAMFNQFTQRAQAAACTI